MEKLIDILKYIKPGIDFETERNLIDDGILDSLEIVEILTAIEEQFSVEIEAVQIDPDNFQSAESIWNMIQKTCR